MKGSIRFTCRRRLRGSNIVSQFSWVVDIPSHCEDASDVNRFIREERQVWNYAGWLCRGVVREGVAVSEIEKTSQRNL